MSLRRLSRLWVVVFCLSVLPRSIEAANILWDGTGNSWNPVTSWSLFSNATTPNPAAKPGASDTAIFNIETVNTSQTVNLNAAQAALGLSFSSTGPVLIQSGAGSNALTLGSGGIVKSPGTGAATISSEISLSAPQSWVNNSSTGLAISGTLTHGSHALTIDGGGATTISGAFSAGSPYIIKNGVGTLTLNGVNTDANADLLINAGSVRIANLSALAAFAGSDVTFGAGSTGSLNLGGNSITLRTLSTNAVVGTPVVENIGGAPATLNIHNFFTTPVTFAGVLRNGTGGGAVGIYIMGPMILSGDNQHTGVTEVNNLLTLGHANALGSTVGGTILDANGDLDMHGYAIGTETLTARSGAVLRNTSVTPASWAGNILFDSTTGDSFTVQGIADMTLSGQILGDGLGMRLEKAGPNTLEITGTANNTAPILVTDGVLRLAKASSAAIHAVDSTAYVAGGTLQLAGTGGDQLAFAVIVSSGSFDVNGRDEQLTALELRGSGIGGIGALVNAASDDSVLSMQPNPFGFGEIRIIDFARIGVTHSDASLTLAGDFESSDGDLQKVGLGTLILSGDNTAYPGDVILSAGTIAVGSNTALGIGALTFDGGALRAEGAPRTIATPMTASSTALVNGAVDLTLSGIISGSAGLTKSGAGRLTLTAANSYAGLTTVNGGTLAVNGSIPGSVEVNTGATLAGSGAIGGAVTLNTGGTIAPGASAESLNIGSLSMSSGSTLVMEIGGTTPVSQYDQLLASGTLAMDGTLTVSLINGYSPLIGTGFVLFGGTISGTFDTINLPALGSGLRWNTSALYPAGVLTVAAGQPGDFDLDGDVDGRDFLAWQRNPSLGDLGDWQNNYGFSSLSAASTAVPEPSCFALLLMTIIARFAKRRIA